MSSFFNLAEQALSAATSGSSGSGRQADDDVRRTGGQEYNIPHHSQQPRYDAQQVMNHAGADDSDSDGQQYITNAMQHVQDNSHRTHNEQVDESSLAKYAPMIMTALSGIASKSGGDVSSLLSGGLGAGGGNQLMGMVMQQAGNAFSGGGGEEKQNFMNGAAMTVAKLAAQGQLSSFIGGSNSGGLGMLSKFM